jgi:hypothetical protein
MLLAIPMLGLIGLILIFYSSNYLVFKEGIHWKKWENIGKEWVWIACSLHNMVPWKKKCFVTPFERLLPHVAS